MQKRQKSFMILLISFCLFLFFAVYVVNSTKTIFVEPKKPVTDVPLTIQEIAGNTPDSNRDDALANPNKVIKVDLCNGHYPYKGNSSELLKEISQYPNLKFLELCRTPINNIPSEISNLKKLEYLHNIDGRLTSIPAPVGQLTNLKYLALSANRITIIADSFGNLENLEELDLSFNPLTEFPQSILKLKNLKKLSLLGTQISRLPDEIKNMPSLEEVDVRSTPITRPEIDRISEILPSHIKLFF